MYILYFVYRFSLDGDVCVVAVEMVHEVADSLP